MRASDAPPPGWYPDPQGRAQLRWWEGTDWSDRYRARPTAASLAFQPPPSANHGHHTAQQTAQQTAHDLAARAASVADSTVWVEQMRMAARGEADRAVQLIDQRMRHARNQFTPLVTEYTSKITRFLKRLAALAILVTVAYVAFQIFAQKSMFDWIGDRIDNFTDESGLVAALLLIPLSSV